MRPAVLSDIIEVLVLHEERGKPGAVSPQYPLPAMTWAAAPLL